MNAPRQHLACPALLWASLPILMSLSACIHQPTALEQSLGDSVRQAVAHQAVRPADAVSERGPLLTDGVIASHGIDRYHQSYARPPAPVSVLNIQTGAAAAPAPMPR